MKAILIAILVLVPLVTAACEQGTPAAVDLTDPEVRPLHPANRGATVTVEEFGPVPLNFSPRSSCFGGTVEVGGSFTGLDRIVERPDGSIHVTTLMDVSNVTITFDGQVWTAGPNASEMFITNFGKTVQIEHVGVVIFRSEDGRPELRLVHRIHVVRLPSGELQLNHQLFDILCIGRN